MFSDIYFHYDMHVKERNFEQKGGQISINRAGEEIKK